MRVLSTTAASRARKKGKLITNTKQPLPPPEPETDEQQYSGGEPEGTTGGGGSDEGGVGEVEDWPELDLGSTLQDSQLPMFQPTPRKGLFDPDPAAQEGADETAAMFGLDGEKRGKAWLDASNHSTSSPPPPQLSARERESIKKSLDEVVKQLQEQNPSPRDLRRRIAGFYWYWVMMQRQPSVVTAVKSAWQIHISGLSPDGPLETPEFLEFFDDFAAGAASAPEAVSEMVSRAAQPTEEGEAAEDELAEALGDRVLQQFTDTIDMYSDDHTFHYEATTAQMRVMGASMKRMEPTHKGGDLPFTVSVDVRYHLHEKLQIRDAGTGELLHPDMDEACLVTRSWRLERLGHFTTGDVHGNTGYFPFHGEEQNWKVVAILPQAATDMLPVEDIVVPFWYGADE